MVNRGVKTQSQFHPKRKSSTFPVAPCPAGPRDGDDRKDGLGDWRLDGDPLKGMETILGINP